MIRRFEFMAAADVFLTREVALLRPHLQLLFLRLHFLCDDSGRFTGDPAEIRAFLYGAALDRISIRDVDTWLRELVTAGLVTLVGDDNGRTRGAISTIFWRPLGASDFIQ